LPPFSILTVFWVISGEKGMFLVSGFFI